jgi:putative oxygen-independent coproporphyrinogen III oxidase
MTALGIPPLALYIHVPWCIRKCEYCDFNSHALRGALPEHEYVQALLRDLEVELANVPRRKLLSLFIGGGTPSLLSGRALQALLNGVRERTDLAADVEITLESNPGALDVERLEHYRKAGINRLSIGVQSFRDTQLRALGRIHDVDAVYAAFNAARVAGFDNVNLDLMFGLPDDDARGSRLDLDSAIGLQPEHLSWYQLTIEPETPFFHTQPSLPNEDRIWGMQQSGLKVLRNAGYEQYEVSAYAKSGARCRHNRNYWEFGDYLGIGAGAHGKITEAGKNVITRRAKVKHPKEYMAKAGTAEALANTHAIDGRQRQVEFMMNALRLIEGFAPELYEERTGLAFNTLHDVLEIAEERGMLRVESECVQPTELGRQYLNELVYLFFADNTERVVVA